MTTTPPAAAAAAPARTPQARSPAPRDPAGRPATPSRTASQRTARPAGQRRRQLPVHRAFGPVLADLRHRHRNLHRHRRASVACRGSLSPHHPGTGPGTGGTGNRALSQARPRRPAETSAGKYRSPSVMTDMCRKSRHPQHQPVYSGISASSRPSKIRTPWKVATSSRRLSSRHSRLGVSAGQRSRASTRHRQPTSFRGPGPPARCARSGTTLAGKRRHPGPGPRGDWGPGPAETVRGRGGKQQPSWTPMVTESRERSSPGATSCILGSLLPTADTGAHFRYQLIVAGPWLPGSTASVQVL